jgi:hypothetical protein
VYPCEESDEEDCKLCSCCTNCCKNCTKCDRRPYESVFDEIVRVLNIENSAALINSVSFVKKKKRRRKRRSFLQMVNRRGSWSSLKKRWLKGRSITTRMANRITLFEVF